MLADLFFEAPGLLLGNLLEQLLERLVLDEGAQINVGVVLQYGSRHALGELHCRR